jgi:ActR/RegA family two-component response regulator
MHANARVLLYSDTDNSGELAGKLEKRGFLPLPASSHEDALRIVNGEYPDIAIVNATSGDQGGRLRDELRALRPDGGIPTIVIGPGTETPEDNLQTECLPAPFRDAELFSRLQVLSRLVTM